MKKRIEKSSEPDARIRIHRVSLVSICFLMKILLIDNFLAIQPERIC